MINVKEVKVQRCNFCTNRGGRRYFEISSDDPDRNLVISVCEVCINSIYYNLWNGLLVRIWECAACGAVLDRDVNAAQVILKAGLGLSLDRKAANG